MFRHIVSYSFTVSYSHRSGKDEIDLNFEAHYDKLYDYISKAAFW